MAKALHVSAMKTAQSEVEGPAPPFLTPFQTQLRGAKESEDPNHFASQLIGARPALEARSATLGRVQFSLSVWRSLIYACWEVSPPFPAAV